MTAAQALARLAVDRDDYVELKITLSGTGPDGESIHWRCPECGGEGMLALVSSDGVNWSCADCVLPPEGQL